MADNPFRGTSLRELSLFYYIKKYLPDAVSRYKFDGEGKKKEIEIYLLSLRIAIEYDGGYWHERKAERDCEKNRFLNENGIYVIRITRVRAAEALAVQRRGH